MLSYLVSLFFMIYVVFVSELFWFMGLLVGLVFMFMLVFSGDLGIWQEVGYYWGLDLVSLVMILLSFVIFFCLFVGGS